MNKQIKAVLFILALSYLLVGCDKITEGEVYDKQYNAAETKMVMTTIITTDSKGNMSSNLVPMWFYYPEHYDILIKKYNSQTDEYNKATYYVEKDVYEATNIGDWFVYDVNTMSDEQIKEEVPEPDSTDTTTSTN